MRAALLLLSETTAAGPARTTTGAGRGTRVRLLPLRPRLTLSQLPRAEERTGGDDDEQRHDGTRTLGLLFSIASVINEQVRFER